MAEKALAKWIAKAELKGYSDQQLRNYLRKKGFKLKDIEDAIKESKQKNIKPSLKPTPLKLFFPLLILILIFASYTINVEHLDPIGKSFCINRDIAEGLTKANEEQDKVIADIEQNQKNLAEHAIFVGLGNVYITFSGAYWLNPFFPAPCETKVMDFPFTNDQFCRYYIEKETYDCFKANKLGTEQGMVSLFNTDLPPYRKITLSNLLFNALLAALLVYGVIVLISWGNLSLVNQTKKMKWIVNSALLALPLLLISIVDWFRLSDIGLIYFFLSIPFILCFSIMSFIKNEHTRKVVLYIFTALLMLLLAAGLWVMYYLMNVSTTIL